ncbi:MAG: cob(I)yrinic acid a,c-diamide adenosyltransferase [Thermotaleaceae bacterium]
MANVYTKTGDKGTTGLLGGSRISKDDLRVSCYGTLDEANSAIGLAYSLITNEDIRNILHHIQQKIFAAGAELASDEKGKKLLGEMISDEDVIWLEQKMNYYLEIIGEQKSFVIPGKSTSSASLHLARTIIRRAERNMITLKKTEAVRETLLRYINRLSDILFVLARVEEEAVIMEAVKSKVLEKLGQFFRNNNLSLEIIEKMAKAAEEKALKMGVPIIFSAVDAGGNLMLFHKMDNALLASIDISINKAYTSAALKIPTHEVASLVQPGAQLYGLQWTNKNRIVVFGGGYPLKIHNEVVGAIGISGGTVEEDMNIALHALRVFELERGE